MTASGPSKRILVTGGAGFIGSHLCERLLAAGNEVLCVDNYYTGRRANVAHLLDDHGVRRPALVRGIRHQADSVAREQVFRDELAARDIPVDEDLVIDGNFWNDTAYRAMWDLLKRRRDMDAVVALNDLSALGTLGALAAAGLRVPEDVALAGFDDIPMAEHAHPPLTTIHQPIYEIGRMVCEKLVRLIAGEELASRSEILEPRLIVRSSCGSLRKQPDQTGR